MRILIIRTSALGDIVHALPALTALRRRFPKARIGWVVERSMAPLLEGHPDIDELLVVALRRWRKEPFSNQTRSEYKVFRDALSAFSADFALDLMGNHKGAFLARLSGAKDRFGLIKPERREPSSALWINRPISASGPHAVDKSLAIAEAFATAFGQETGQVTEQQTGQEGEGEGDAEASVVDFAGDRLAEIPAEGQPKAPYGLLFPATGWTNKNYPPERLGQAAAEISAKTGLPIYLSPGPGEEEIAEEVASAAGGMLQTLPIVPIPALVGLARRADLAIGGDTGPIHLAHAVGTRVLCIMGPTDPEKNGPYAAPEKVVFERLPCSFCYKRYDEAKPCLLEIPPSRVVEKALALLQNQ